MTRALMQLPSLAVVSAFIATVIAIAERVAG